MRSRIHTSLFPFCERLLVPMLLMMAIFLLRRRVSDARIKGSSVPVRDESGKFVGVRPQTAAERRQASAQV